MAHNKRTFLTLIDVLVSAGAAVIIFAAWAKLTHQSYADMMLTIGMWTETAIFLVYAIIEWVKPKHHEEDDEPADAVAGNPSLDSMDKMLQSADITPTSLKKLGNNWYQRTFITTGIAAQINPVFNAPLFLNSVYGLPYFNPENINSDLRSTIKLESVFYNLKKVLGFRFAPFIFSDFSLLKPTKGNFNKSDGFSAVGGGVRTRNENLVFGTMELKAYYFPRTNGDMNVWKIELNTNIRFKYNSTFIKRPDFVNAN